MGRVGRMMKRMKTLALFVAALMVCVMVCGSARAASTWYLDGSQALAVNPPPPRALGDSPDYPGKDWSDVTIAAGDIVYHKNMRGSLTLTVSNVTLLLWDTSSPSPRGDTAITTGAWTDLTGGLYRTTAAFTPALANVGAVVVNYDSAPRVVRRFAIVSGNTTAFYPRGGTVAGAFAAGETVTQTGTGATGSFICEGDGYLYLLFTPGGTAFSAAGLLTGGSSGATRTPAAVTICGPRAAHLAAAASLAAVTGTNNTWYVGADSGTNRLYVHTSGFNPTLTDVVSYTGRWTSGDQLTGVTLTGNGNTVEAYPCLFTEASGFGTGGGGGVLCIGNSNTVKLYGCEDFGYKMAAYVISQGGGGSEANGGTITLVAGGNFASAANTDKMGITSNGNACITVQGGDVAPLSSCLIEATGADVFLNGCVKVTGAPLSQAGDNSWGLAYTLNHGNWTPLAGGMVIRGGRLVNVFEQACTSDLGFQGPRYDDGTFAARYSEPADRLDPSTYPVRVQDVHELAATRVTFTHDMALERCELLCPPLHDAVNTPLGTAPFQGNGGSAKVGAFSCIFGFTGDYGQSMIASDAHGFLVHLNCDYITIYNVASGAGQKFFSIGASQTHTPYIRGGFGFCTLYTGSADTAVRRLLSGTPTVDIQGSVFAGLGGFNDNDAGGTGLAMPCSVDSSGAIGSGAGFDNSFAGDVAAATLMSAFGRNNFEPLYAARSAGGVLSVRRMAVHAQGAYNGQGYSGTPGAYQYGGGLRARLRPRGRGE